MSLQGIAFYCARAAAFAALVAGLWYLWQRRFGRPLPRRKLGLRLVFVFYLAALVEITAIRSGAGLLFWRQPHSWATVQLIPLYTTRLEWRAGLWPFCYHVLGNLGWFVPLGLLGPMVSRRLRSPVWTVAAGALLSAGIEACQWLFASGATDVDDFLLNTAGALLGWCAWRVWQMLRAER